MNNWFTILKGAKQISSTEVKTKLGTRPLTITDNEDEFPCCEEAREKVLQEIDFREKDFIKRIDCEALYHTIKYQFPDIAFSWEECVSDQAKEHPHHDEQRGWYDSYLDV